MAILPPLRFEGFDPLNGEVRSWPLYMLPSIAARARRLLAGRTREEIFNAAYSIDWFLEEYFKNEKEAFIQRLVTRGGWELGYLNEEDRHEGGIRDLLDNWPSEADDRPDFPTSENTLEVDALRECIGSYVLTDDEEFPNARPFEYFAVLALGSVAEAIYRLRWNPRDKLPPDLYELFVKNSDKSDKCSNLRNAADSALQAMDAVCEGELLRATEPLIEEATRLRTELQRMNAEIESIASTKVKERISVAASKAAIRRHAENHLMKAQVFAWCDENMAQFTSMDKAAEAIARKLIPVSFRTARDWIGAWQKKLRSARRP